MEKEELEKYNDWHNKRSVDIDLKAKWHLFAAEQIKNINLKDKIILEIGCGRGGFAYWLSNNYNKQYAKFIAADFSEVGVAKGKKYAKDNWVSKIEWSVQDIMNINLPTDYFDVVISCETIEHVPNPYQAIKELYRVTKPGGKLILTTPNYGNLFGLYRIYLRLTGRKWTEGGQPINQFMIFSKTKRWIKNAGFNMLTAETQNIAFPSPIHKKLITLNWKTPKWLVNRLGLSSFFVAVK